MYNPIACPQRGPDRWLKTSGTVIRGTSIEAGLRAYRTEQGDSRTAGDEVKIGSGRPDGAQKRDGAHRMAAQLE